MGAEDESYFNQVWIQCGQTSLMGAEWCVDYVKGSLITDQTVSLPGRVQADRNFTQPGRRRAHAQFCFSWTLPVCKKCFSAVLTHYRGQCIWQSPRSSLTELWPVCTSVLNISLSRALIWNSYRGHFASVLNELWSCQNLRSSDLIN